MKPTVTPKQRKARKRKSGRKKKRPSTASKVHQKVKFEETPIGHFLYVYAPMEYCLLMEYCQAVRCRNKAKVITPYLLETIALNSDIQAFRTERFRRALVSYRRWQLRPYKPAKWTTKDAVYYARYSYRIHQSMNQCVE